MKNLSFIDKVIFFFNSLAAFFLLASYIIPFVPPKVTATVSVLSLGMPVLIIVNILFFIFWIVKIKKQFFLSLLILAIGYQHINAFVQFGNSDSTKQEDSIKIMSYNVRLFNAYKWSKKNDLDKNIYEFINVKSPDIISFQEYYPKKDIQLRYPYTYIVKTKKSSARQAIYSKHKIVNKGSLDFKKSGNNCIYADIKTKNDTIRIYNLHLQSFSIDKNKNNFGEKDSEKLFHKFTSRFIKQQTQVEKIINHAKNTPYKTIFMGDFNNTAFSWVYNQLSKDKKDTFIEAGSGFGKSFDYIFPFRIDFILTDTNIKIQEFDTYRVNYSDHYPIMTRITL